MVFKTILIILNKMRCNMKLMKYQTNEVREAIFMNFTKNYNCPNCNSNITVDLKNYVIDVSEYENEMGTEYEHSIECENNCINCKEEYLISGSIWEYPVGSENLDDTRIE